MSKEILIPLTQEDRLAQFIPFIEQLVQPGMKVVLLMRFAPNRGLSEIPPAHFKRSAFDVSELRSGNDDESVVSATKRGSAHPWDARRLSAEREVFLAGERLHKQGVEIVAHVYAGSLRAALNSHLRNGNVQLIMKRARWYRPVANFIDRFFAHLGVFGDGSASRVLLFRANAATT